MTASFLDYFKTDKYDNKMLLKNGAKSYSIKEIKAIIYSKIEKLKNIEAKNIMLSSADNLHFIFNFLACIFTKKEIYLNNDNFKKNLFKDCYLFKDKSTELNNNYQFETIEPENIFIYFYTSGTTSSNKCIKKTLKNLINESIDILKEFHFSDNEEFITTTTLNHLFGITFYLMLPLNNGSIINTDLISYPENINHKNAVLISTPSFLKQLQKYNYEFENKLKYIISAGSKLETEVFKYASLLVENNVIDIYGSTETGVIAYKISPENNLKLFYGIKIIETNENNTKIESNYSINKFDFLGDKIEQNDSYIRLIGRCDNILKIQEKRVSITELEEKISDNKFIEENCCIEYNGKVACLAALNIDGINYIKNNDTIELIKYLKKEISNKFEIIPQKWKFINALPRTKNGKLNKKQIKDIFGLNVSLPLIVDEKICDNEAFFELYFYKHSNFFKGHFEGFPILPGVAQLFFAAFFTKWAFNIECNGGQYKKIKFSNLIKPDEQVTLHLSKNTSGITYIYKKEEVVLSSGLLPLNNIYKAVDL